MVDRRGIRWCYVCPRETTSATLVPPKPFSMKSRLAASRMACRWASLRAGRAPDVPEVLFLAMRAIIAHFDLWATAEAGGQRG